MSKSFAYSSTDVQSAAGIHLPTGFFITLEGLEGSGKSTQANLLLEWFQSQGYDAILVREPGGTDLGADLRQLFFKYHDSICGAAEVGILLAAKAELLEKVIQPALLENKIVICDRYTDTLYAYQHGAKGHPTEMIDRMVDAFGCDLNPDFTVFYHITPEEAVERSQARRLGGGEFNNLDDRPAEFHRWVLNGFRERFDSRPGRDYAVVSGIGASPEEILETRVIPRVIAAMQFSSYERQIARDDIPEC